MGGCSIIVAPLESPRVPGGLHSTLAAPKRPGDWLGALEHRPNKRSWGCLGGSRGGACRDPGSWLGRPLWQ